MQQYLRRATYLGLKDVSQLWLQPRMIAPINLSCRFVSADAHENIFCFAVHFSLLWLCLTAAIFAVQCPAYRLLCEACQPQLQQICLDHPLFHEASQLPALHGCVEPSFPEAHIQLIFFFFSIKLAFSIQHPGP